MEIDDIVFRLVEVIKISPEFQRIRQAKAIIMKNPSLARELEEINISQKQLLNERISKADLMARSEHLNSKLDNLSKIPEVRNYIDALNSLNQLMGRINYKINDYLEKSLQ